MIKAKNLRLGIIPLLFIIWFMPSCVLLRHQATQGDTCGSYYANDTLRYDFTFHAKGKVKSIEKYVKQHGWWSRLGYHYTFHENGRLEKVTFFERGSYTPFVISQSREGQIVELTSFEKQNMLESINYTVNNPVNSTRKGITPITGTAPNGNIKINYEISTGKITSIEEYDDEPTGPNRYRIFKSGIYVLLDNGTISNVWNYHNSERIGENLIFNKRGKLQKFYYKGSEGLGLAYKVKDLREVVSANPCDDD